MFRLFALLLITSSLLSIPACSSSGEYVPPPTEDAMTSDAKKMILDYVEAAKKSRNEGAANAAGLNESLEAIENPQLDKVKATSKELAELYSRSAPQSEINATLDKLAEQAESL